MPKYNFEMDLSETTSTGIIVKKLKRGMTVLEFGCSYGRMTRYMKEALDCNVYIVEYDSEAYERAIKYAEDGICGDIQKYEWVTKFKDIKFDAIIFADVLEHLSEPVEVLKTAGNMLAEGGKVLISVPNITHNDIILKSYMDRIDYTSIGLLDDTHVHFWGLNNLEDFARDSELYIETVEATYEKTGLTEQFKGTELKTSQLLLNILNERKAGEVYQFLITMQKTPVETTEDNYHLEQPYVYSNIYLDRGQGFNASDIIPVKAPLSKNGAYYVNYRIEDTKDLRCIRFDPIEYQGCLLKYLNVRQGTKRLPLQYSDSIVFEEEVLIKGMDPQVTIPIEDNDDPISIDSEFLIRGEEYVDSLEKNISDLRSQSDEYASQLNGHKKLVNDLQELINQKEIEYKKLLNDLEVQLNNNEVEYRKCISDLEKQIADNLSDYNQEKNDLRRAYEQEIRVNQDVAEKEKLNLRKQLDEKIILLGSYQTLADSKDTYIVKLDKTIKDKDADIVCKETIIAEKETIIAEKDVEIAERNERIAELDHAIEHYRKYPGIRIIRFIGKVLRGIKRRIKALVQ